MRWADHVAHMAEMRNAYKILLGESEVTKPVERTRVRW